jgi:hypothetical protein
MLDAILMLDAMWRLNDGLRVSPGLVIISRPSTLPLVGCNDLVMQVETQWSLVSLQARSLVLLHMLTAAGLKIAEVEKEW